MKSSPSRNGSSSKPVVEKAAWGKLGVHTVTLPSGAVVRIRIPDLSMLLAADAVPERLRDLAFEEVNRALRPADAASELMTDERLKGLAQLQRYLVAQMLVEPSFEEEELGEAIRQNLIPPDDLLILTQFASRDRVHDARGVRLGIEPLDRFQVWANAHGCGTDCAHCEEVVAAFSSLLG